MNEHLYVTVKSLQADLAILNEKETSYERFVKRGFDLISDLSNAYANYSPTVKEKVIGSIFPEKMIFEETKVRTARINSALSIFALKINGLEIDEKEKAGKDSSFVKQAPPSGLEPETL